MVSTTPYPQALQHSGVTVADSMDIERRPWVAVAGCAGVRAKELVRSSDTTCVLIAFEPGATTPGSPHPNVQHHIWVVSGVAAVAGRQLPAGSYVFVPRGVAHPIAADASGCLLLQVQQRCPSPPGVTRLR
jgi:quercetin dioxygenase-like cupin family protein